MANKHNRYVFQAMTAAGALLLLGCSATSLQSGRSIGLDYAAQEAGEQQDAGAKPDAKRQARRMRTSLSLPYFSFAQSLNPRS